METFFALQALCAGNSPVTGEFTAQRSVTESFDVFFDLRLYKPLSNQCADQRKHQSSASLAFVGEVTGDRGFPAQKACDAEMLTFDDVIMSDEIPLVTDDQ